MAKNHIVSVRILKDAKATSQSKLVAIRAQLSNIYGDIVYKMDDVTVSLLHDLFLIRNKKSPKVYIRGE